MPSTFTLLFIQYTQKIKKTLKKGSIVLNKKLIKTSLILTTTQMCACKNSQKKNRLEDWIHPQESIASSNNESEKTNLFPAIASYVGPGISDGRRGNRASKLTT